jgi:hypothetical protein
MNSVRIVERKHDGDNFVCATYRRIDANSSAFSNSQAGSVTLGVCPTGQFAFAQRAPILHSLSGQAVNHLSGQMPVSETAEETCAMGMIISRRKLLHFVARLTQNVPSSGT